MWKTAFKKFDGLWSPICGALRDLVPFVQFKKREKHSWRSVNFSKVADKPDLVRDMDINIVNIKFKKKL